MNDDLIADSCWIVPADAKEPAYKVTGLRFRDLEGVQLFGPVLYRNADAPPLADSNWVSASAIKATIDAYIKNQAKRDDREAGLRTDWQRMMAKWPIDGRRPRPNATT